MARGNYMSFQELKDSVSETYSSIAQLLEKFDWGFFSEDGQNKIETYAILDDCFRIADDLNELVKYVADEIHKLGREVREAASEKDASEKKEVVKYLARYIRHNCEEELWIDYEEFDHSHYKRGC